MSKLFYAVCHTYGDDRNESQYVSYGTQAERDEDCSLNPLWQPVKRSDIPAGTRVQGPNEGDADIVI